jgi:hypothetical protein
MNKYAITKYVQAEDITSAMLKEKKAPVAQIILIEEPEENKVGF